MKKFMRTFLLIVAIIQIAAAVGLFFQLEQLTSRWPFPGTTPLTFIFIASIFAAAGASTLWVALSQNYGALAGIGMDYVTILLPVAIFSMMLGSNGQIQGLFTYGIICAIGVLFGLFLLIWSIRIPMDTSIPMPGLVRWSFVVFIIALLIVSTSLIFKVPNVIPWSITPELSVVIGWMFMGAAVYFAYGLLRPSWVNSAGQLWGFLAYDVVLVVPFIWRLPSVAPEHRLGQYIYLAVVIYSGLVAVYFLFLNPETRFWRSRNEKTLQPSARGIGN